MPTPAEVIDLVSRRVLWLEGKNAELRPQLEAVRSETDWATRTWGARPSAWLGYLQDLTPTGQRWSDLDHRLAAQVGPYAANVRRAVASLQEVQPQFEAAEQSATAAQMQQLNLLAGRVNTALSEGARIYNQWVTYPSARFDTENVPLSERMFRAWVRLTSITAGPIEATGLTPHTVWEATGQPAIEAAESYEAERTQTSVFGQHAVPSSTPGGGGTKGGSTGPGDVERAAWSIRDKLAVVGVASIGLTALYLFLKVKRAIPFV